MKIIAAMVLVGFSAASYAQHVKINISNQSTHADVYTAKIRLATGNDWILLGTVYPGNNVFEVNQNVDDGMGSLWLEKSKEEKWVTHFEKGRQLGNISLEVKKDNMSDQSPSTDGAVGSVNYTIDFDRVGVRKAASSKLYKLSPDANNSWFTNCNFVSWETENQLVCAISSSPSIAFRSTQIFGGGWPIVGASIGNFSSSYSPQEIKGKGSRFSLLAALFYMKIGFGSLGEFNGGGFGAGAMEGAGMFF
ncbi:hypothetical protein [Chromobacterium phragmitis]|uniref:DOMON domain-containing protein n=1 Tax=Chromobacterium phragmitis TaxID=2202141 RepID=A0ABV0IWP7_9NEIS